MVSVSFHPCPSQKTYAVDGAVLVSQVTSDYLKTDSKCTLHFQVRFIYFLSTRRHHVKMIVIGN